MTDSEIMRIQAQIAEQELIAEEAWEAFAKIHPAVHGTSDNEMRDEQLRLAAVRSHALTEIAGLEEQLRAAKLGG